MSEHVNDDRSKDQRGPTANFARVEAATHAALDAGRDPLADEAVLAALVDAPEAFERVVRLTQDARGLARLAPSSALPVTRRRLAPFAAAAAVLMIAIAVALAFAPDRAQPVDRDDALAGRAHGSRDGQREPTAQRESTARADRSAGAPDVRDIDTNARPSGSPAPATPASVVESLALTLTSGPPDARETIALARRPGQTHTTLIRSVHGFSPSGDVVLLTTEERLP
jgi:hypothetical protein